MLTCVCGTPLTRPLVGQLQECASCGALYGFFLHTDAQEARKKIAKKFPGEAIFVNGPTYHLLIGLGVKTAQNRLGGEPLRAFNAAAEKAREKI